MPGKYETFIVKDEMPLAVLAVHSDYTKKLNTDWKPHALSVCVESYMVGIFDDTIYPEDKKSVDEWCNECVELTFNDVDGGILKNKKGVVASTGYCDNMYEILKQHNNGECIALMIDFGIAGIDIGSSIEELMKEIEN